MRERMTELIAQMTLEEKASLCSGKDFWHLKGVARLGIPEIMVTDGPHGLRKQAGSSDHLGLNASVPATCFPPAVTTASSWNPECVSEMGQAIGAECVQEGVAVILGPGVNMKRSPLCGRNFEYFSEDPFLAGEMGAAWVNGVQSQGIGTSLKHYAANNQEKARLISNSIVDDRAFHEIYLTAFEKTVKQAQPWTIMCSYNRINGIYACENEELLTQWLRNQWGFKGIVMTDWGAMNNRVKALKAGLLELEMPGPATVNDHKICAAVKNGELDESLLDAAVAKLLTLILKSQEIECKSYDQDAHHRIAGEVAAQSMILLKNEDSVLPLQKDKSYAVIGAFAKTPRYQGAGSSKINPHRIDNLLEAFTAEGVSYEYAPGYSLKKDDVDEGLMAEACACAKEKDGVILCIGLPDEYESEGYDRAHLNLPESHNVLVDELLKVNSNVVVVLLCGSAVLMPWRERVKGILLAYLGGQAVGSACAPILTGRVNPSGRLAETFPLSLEDTPCYAHFAGEGKDVEYRESIFIGYRYYDWAKKEVAYPFGYGLSYTTFSYNTIKAYWNAETQTGSVTVSVTNTGSVKGQEVVQIYIGKAESKIMRVPKELKGFTKVTLNPGETKEVVINLDGRSFSYYDVQEKQWAVEAGTYQVYAAASSRDIRLQAEVAVEGKEVAQKQLPYTPEQMVKDGAFYATQADFETLYGGKLPFTEVKVEFDVNSTVTEVLAVEAGEQVLGGLVADISAAFTDNSDHSRMMLAMLKDMPLRSLGIFGTVTLDQIERMVARINLMMK